MKSIIARCCLNRLIVGLVCTSLLLAGCSSSAKQEEYKKAAILECGFPDSPSLEAPTWVCDFPVPGVQVSAVGSHKSNAGVSFTKDQAIADARGKLAGQMRTHIKKMIKRFVETTGKGDEETVDAVQSVVQKNITSETVYGSRVFRSIANPETKRIYVLVGLDTQAVTENAREAIKKARTSINDSKAQYQRNLSKEAMKDLEQEVSALNNEVGTTTPKSES